VEGYGSGTSLSEGDLPWRGLLLTEEELTPDDVRRLIHLSREVSGTGGKGLCTTVNASDEGETDEPLDLLAVRLRLGRLSRGH
jgi:hypothetical protein